MACSSSHYGAVETGELLQAEPRQSDDCESCEEVTYQRTTTAPEPRRESSFGSNKRPIQLIVMVGLVVALFMGYSTTTTTIRPATAAATQHGPFVVGPMMGDAVVAAVVAEEKTSSDDIGGREDEELFYHQQLIDHNVVQDASSSSNNYYSHRYYEKVDYFAGPGSPIFVIVGGEDSLERILYPFISEHLAKHFSALTLCIEHRFYGKSWPTRDHHPTNEELKELLSPTQAMKDLVRLVRYKQDELGCSHDKNSPLYCPVITVGGSYPGFLSAMLRILYSDTIDIAYASSAPLYLYSQSVDQGAYYEKVSDVAEEASPGCRDAVKENLLELQKELQTGLLQSSSSSSSPNDDQKDVLSTWLSNLGICTEIPQYIEEDPEIFTQELFMIANSFFADMNMEYYPPTDQTALIRACRLFEEDDLLPTETMKQLLQLKMTEEGTDSESSCLDMLTELPGGPFATISGSDWSGMGSGEVAWIWDFQCCTLMPAAGFSDQSMFPTRDWTLDWLVDHCDTRFDLSPEMGGLVHELFGPNFTSFDDLLMNGGGIEGSVPPSSYILFTNGMRDGWSIASILRDMSDTMVAINLENGAHHSDLSHQGPTPADTEDIQQAFVDITHLFDKWLSDITPNSINNNKKQ